MQFSFEIISSYFHDSTHSIVVRVEESLDINFHSSLSQATIQIIYYILSIYFKMPLYLSLILILSTRVWVISIFDL